MTGRRLNIKWGKSQGQTVSEKEEEKQEEQILEPVPGLPGGKKLVRSFLVLAKYMYFCVTEECFFKYYFLLTHYQTTNFRLF